MYTVPKGALEVVEYVPREAVMAGAVQPDHPYRSEDLWSRLRLEHRTLTSCAAALAVGALHILLIAPVIWSGGASASRQERFRGDPAMQWVVLNDPSTNSALRSPAPPSVTLQGIAVTAAVSTLPFERSPLAASGAQSDQSDDEPGLGAMYGRYVGQIRARIDRAWQRPRTAIGAPIFQCEVQVDQDSRGRVNEVTLLDCNGDTRWQLSLVHAIEAASPFPAPPNPAVFAHRVDLAFRAIAYAPGAQSQLYEPPGTLETAPKRQRDTLSQNAFEALREAARAPHSQKIIELRIEGSNTEVEPEHQ
jgi:hypothetical protein